MIKNAVLKFNKSGTPVTEQFDDIYFSTQNGLEESLYVFYEKNDITKRLRDHDQTHFVVAETGFGTGLNFLNTWQQFDLNNTKNVKKLHFISFEKFPLKKHDLKKALSHWPALATYIEQLIEKYPIALTGCHRIEFNNGSIILDLWLGDLTQNLPNLHSNRHGIIDAWYLDGFAPSKNPDMWQQSLFNTMADLGRENCTFATFTAAGFVRRGLIQAGFNVKKAKGYGKKREMIFGQLIKANNKRQTAEYYPRTAQKIEKIAIIGGGISSATLALSLSKRAAKFDVFCKDDDVAMGASKNNQAAFYPHLQVNFSRESQFYAHSFLYAKQCYQNIQQLGFNFIHSWCGVLLHAITPEKQKRQSSLIERKSWPEALIRAVSASEASELAKVETPYSGLFIEQGGWLNPPSLIKAIFSYCHKINPFQLYKATKINSYYKKNGLWYLKSEQQEYGPYSQVIVAAGEHSNEFQQNKAIDLHPVRGQVSHVKTTHSSAKLATVICHKGYITPQHDDQHCIGATFEKNTFNTDVKQSDNQLNLSQLQTYYDKCEFSKDLNNVTGAKAAIRCTSLDHLPLLGQIPDRDNFNKSFATLKYGSKYGYLPYISDNNGLYIFTGLGARGFCSAPLCAEILCSELFNEPLPVDLGISSALHPARFLVRNLKRNSL